MLESGLRFAFAFLPAGVAVVVGLVLAIQRRRVQPDVATPAMWGLGLQLVAIIAGALVNVIPSSIVQSGGDASTALTVATVIALVVAALTVVSWVLILTALFRRLPSAAGADAPTTAVPTPPPGFMPEPFADDAPTGRHALLDEHGQQVVAQPGVRLSPQTAGLAAGAVGAAGLGAAAAASGSDASVPEHTADLPTEAVPIVGGRATSGDSNASLLASSDRESGSVDQPDPGPAGVDESAVGGTPTGAEPDDAAAPSSTGQVVPPPAPVAAADPGPAGVDEAAVGGTPTGPDRSADGEHDTDLTPVPDTEVVGVAAEGDVDEAAVGGTPTTADADRGTPADTKPDTQAGADRTSSSGPAAAPVRPTPRPQPSAPFAAAGTSPEQSGAAPSAPFADAGSSPERSGAAPSAPFAAAASAERSDGGPSSPAQSSAPFPAVSGASTEQAVAPSSTSSPASSSPGSSSPASGPQPAVAPSADAAASGPQPAARPHSGPQPSATSSSFAAPMPAAPRSQPATPPADASAGSGSPSSQAAAPTSAARNGGHGSDHEEPADPPSGSTPASHPGLAGAMRSPRPAPSPGGSDLFTPSAPIPEVAEEAVGGTPAEPQEARRSTRAPVAGWFEPVTDGTAEGFGTENRDN